MQFLKYISFSKAEIIEKINERDQKNKKNGLAYNQIKKFLEAPKIELKAKWVKIIKSWYKKMFINKYIQRVNKFGHLYIKLDIKT